MGDYLEGYAQALTNVLEDFEDAVGVWTISDFRSHIKHMIDDTDSE